MPRPYGVRWGAGGGVPRPYGCREWVGVGTLLWCGDGGGWWGWVRAPHVGRAGPERDSGEVGVPIFERRAGAGEGVVRPPGWRTFEAKETRQC